MKREREREREREIERERGVNHKFINLRSFSILSVLKGSADEQYGYGPCITHPGGRGRPPYPKGTNGRADMGRN